MINHENLAQGEIDNRLVVDGLTYLAESVRIAITNWDYIYRNRRIWG